MLVCSMNLDKSYWNAMDKEAATQYLASPLYLGASAPPFEKQLGALKGKIFEGASNVELGFMGKGKGSIQGGNITPGMHSKEEREDMRQLAKINDVTLSTHASPNAGSLAGLSRDGTFSDTEREKSVMEVKRAIDFAADVAEGGPIVVHTGEFQRAIYGSEKGPLKKKFEAYPDERKKMTHYLVDDRTGKVFQAVREDETLYRPRDLVKDGKKVQRLDADGKPMTMLNPITNKEDPVYRFETDSKCAITVDQVDYHTFKKELIEKGVPEREAPLYFFWELRKREMESQLGNADEYEIHYRNSKEAVDKLKKLRKTYAQLEKNATKEGLEHLKMQVANKAGQYLEGEAAQRLNSISFKTPTELIDRAIWHASKNMSYGQNISLSARRQYEKMGELVKDTRLIEDYALKKTSDSIARTAMHAYEKEKAMKLKKPLFIAPENVFPEQYGAHPDELKNIVVRSREAMANKLVKQKKMGRGMAKKVAEEHIKATIDIGHLNTWRKYFSGSDEDFKKWVLTKTKDLFKSKIVGHIHLSDNFGYEDEHVSAGEGTAPIKDFVKEIRKQGYKGPMIVEAGAQDKGQAWKALTTAMRHFNSPVYQIEGASVGWADIEHGYFGRVKAGPSYVVGAYAPDIGLPTEHRSWTFWSGVPME